MIFELQRASILKRISALLLDIILLAILAVGFALPISYICKYNKYTDAADRYYDEYGAYQKLYKEQLETSFGVEFYEALDELMASDYETLSEENKAAYDAYNTLTPAEEVNRTYIMVYNIMLIMTSLGLALAYLVLEFILPLILKNGQTVGKKVFGLGLVRPDCVRINNVALFTRTILGKYAIETMVVLFTLYLIMFANIGIIGLIVILGVILLDLGLLIFTRDHTTIHDLIAGTVVVDITSQMIFNTEADLIAKKEEVSLEEAQKAEYR